MCNYMVILIFGGKCTCRIKINIQFFHFSDIYSMVQFTFEKGRDSNRKFRRRLSKWFKTYVTIGSNFWGAVT